MLVAFLITLCLEAFAQPLPSLTGITTAFTPPAGGPITLNATVSIQNPDLVSGKVSVIVTDEHGTVIPGMVPQVNSQAASVQFNNLATITKNKNYIVKAKIVDATGSPSTNCDKCFLTKVVNYSEITPTKIPETSLLLAPIIALIVLFIIKRH